MSDLLNCGSLWMLRGNSERGHELENGLLLSRFDALISKPILNISALYFAAL